MLKECLDLCKKIDGRRHNSKVLAVAIVYEVMKNYNNGDPPKGLKKELRKLIGVAVQTGILHKKIKGGNYGIR